jgi:hypothetical protein
MIDRFIGLLEQILVSYNNLERRVQWIEQYGSVSNDHEPRIAALELQFSTMKGIVMNLREQVEGLTGDIEALQNGLDTTQTSLKTNVDKLFALIADQASQISGIDLMPLRSKIQADLQRIQGFADMALLPDTETPSMPTGLTGNATGDTSVSLVWAASTDNVAVKDYEVFRDGVSLGFSPSPSFSDTGLQVGTPYTYSVRARDAADNKSSMSENFTVKTTGGPTQ